MANAICFLADSTMGRKKMNVPIMLVYESVFRIASMDTDNKGMHPLMRRKNESKSCAK
jgi:hypothetical protein